MAAFLNPPLVAQNGRALRVILPGRVSDPRPGKQDERSLQDQEDIQRRWLEQRTDLDPELTVLSGSGSGEMLEREEYLRLLELIESGEFDLVLTEDLGRIVRRVAAYQVCELCEDHGVRLISINNHNVDTAQPGWRDAAFFASYFYEKDNADKSARLKERLRSRFLNGGALARPIYGYVESQDTRSEHDLQKDPEAEPIYKEWFRRLDEEGHNFAEIADWLNSQGIPTGRYTRQKLWAGTMVGRITRNWILKGLRFRGKRRTKRINKTGKYVSLKAPNEDLLVRRVPHLAFFDEAYYDRIVAKVDARNAKFKRKSVNGRDPRSNVSKKRTRLPGQCVQCGVCGRMYVFGGHGQKDRLMCSGARLHQCWNGATFDGDTACQRLTARICDEIEGLPAFEPEFLAMLEVEKGQHDKSRTSQLQEVQVDRQRNERDIANIVEALRESGGSKALLAELQRLEKGKAELEFRASELVIKPAHEIRLPPIHELKQAARAEFARLAVESWEFARLMRRLVPSAYVFPFRHFDGGKVVLRASLTFTVVPFVARDAEPLGGLQERLSKQLRINLFDPPQHEGFRERVVQLRRDGLTEKEAAACLGITETVAQRAAALQRKMDARGIDDPLQPIVDPPVDDNKFRRHRHERYQFQPLKGFPLSWPA